jgi:hypothetical protein
MTDQPKDETVGGGDPTFEAQDAKLNKDLSGIDRARAGSKGAEFPHDENYAPGYHEGGTRFGFFNGKASSPPPAKDDKKP